ncbi:MAG TPA: Fe-S-containing hydro-lyase [bacterium]|nr:Fe-S-containing hydro-lyase [bacterium]
MAAKKDGNVWRLSAPLTDEDVSQLKAGDKVLFDGVMYTGRDAAHKRMVETLDRGEKLPVDLKGQVIYYVGPSATKPGMAIGSAGPTTGGRMDSYSPRLLDLGLKAMVGKGGRAQKVIDSMKKNKAIYLASTGGAGALLARAIKKSDIVAYEELGPEAIRRLEVKDFPCVVVNDVNGRDLYAENLAAFRDPSLGPPPPPQTGE